MHNKLILCLSFLLSAGCATHKSSDPVIDGPPAQSIDLAAITDPEPKDEPLSRHGNPPDYHVNGQNYQVIYDNVGYKESGIASWYGTKFHDHPTSSGEPYDMFAMTAAHKQLPLPSYVRVKNLENGREITVKVTDRGPFKDDRIIDLSYVAAQKLGIIEKGTALVEIEAINPDDNGKNSGQQTIQVFLQAGAFKHRQRAEQLQLKLQDIINHPVNINPIEGVSHISYRVQIGPFHDADHIKGVSRQLQTAGFEDSFTVIE